MDNQPKIYIDYADLIWRANKLCCIYFSFMCNSYSSTKIIFIFTLNQKCFALQLHNFTAQHFNGSQCVVWQFHWMLRQSLYSIFKLSSLIHLLLQCCYSRRVNLAVRRLHANKLILSDFIFDTPPNICLSEFYLFAFGCGINYWKNTLHCQQHCPC